jgi:hypothetical protein
MSLFDLDIVPAECQTPEELIEALRHGEVYRYRTRTIRSGPMMELEVYPVWDTRGKARAARANPSRAAQEKLNHRNAKKKITRLLNCNFTDADLWGTFGYDETNLPGSPEEALKDVQNFIRRLKRRRKKLRLAPLKYLYVTEWGKDGDRVRCHHHVVMSGGMARDDVEAAWDKGAYPQTRRLRVKEDCGLDGLASYLGKGSRHEKMWNCSRGLARPKETVADRKVTPRQAERLALDENAAPGIFERACRGYAFRGMEVKRSDFAAGVYIYVKMYKRRS